MIPKDKRVSPCWWTGPNVSSFVSTSTGRCQVRHQHFVIDISAARTRTKMFNRVQVGNVDSLALTSGGRIQITLVFVVAIILLDVHAKDTNVKAVNLLKESNRNRSVSNSLGWKHARLKMRFTALGRNTKVLPYNIRHAKRLFAIRNDANGHGLIRIRAIRNHHSFSNLLLNKCRYRSLLELVGTENRRLKGRRIVVSNIVHGNGSSLSSDKGEKRLVGSLGARIVFRCAFAGRQRFTNARRANILGFVVNKFIVHGTNLMDTTLTLRTSKPVFGNLFIIFAFK
mmetsp:Transcript_27237/g.49239  ORF Transcript_27237/g.49239 Transcript_27237/m.49239 type:complete len:284 (+) Transcript_27237:1871-2722(+)